MLRKKLGIAIPWLSSGVLICILFTDSWLINHRCISSLPIPEPYAWFSALAFLLFGFPLQDPYLRFIRRGPKPQVSVENSLFNIELYAQNLAKLDKEVDDIEVKIPELNMHRKNDAKKKCLVNLEQMESMMSIVQKDLSFVARTLWKFKKSIDDSNRRLSHESN